MAMIAEPGSLSYGVVSQLAGYRLGVVDVACPSCGPDRQSAVNQRRKVLRVWRGSPTFLTYRCARCDVHGFAREYGAAAPDPAMLAKARSEAQRFAVETADAKRRKARWLWGRRRPIVGTIAERYLRDVRRYEGALPATIGFLPARGDFNPAMIAAFAVAGEAEPEVLGVAPERIQGVHLTRLAFDGSGKAGTEADKIMLGTPRGSPIVLAPMGDLLGLAITEGIEDALSVHEATGLGVWAAGAASFMPALAEAIPAYVDFVTIVADPDKDGRRFATELKARLARGEIAHRLIVWGDGDRIAA